MTSLRYQKTFICGLSTAFISRNNDYDGYWAPGILCGFAIGKEICELSASINDIYDCSRFIIADINLRHIYKFILRNRDKFLLQETTLGVYIKFNTSKMGLYYLNGLLQYRATLDVSLTRNGKSIKTSTYFECWPHSKIFEHRSSRSAV